MRLRSRGPAAAPSAATAHAAADDGGSREKTASMLGVSIATLYRKMGLNVERKTTV